MYPWCATPRSWSPSKERFRGRDVPDTNYKQADVPVGAVAIKPVIGSAPGLICPVKGPAGDQVIYAVPGVPAEMREMVEGTIVPDLVRRSGEVATIRSRFLRVWGVPESKVAQIVAPRLEALEGGPTTIAFLASATEGVRVRVTTRARGHSSAAAAENAERALEVEEAALRALLGEAVGGVDAEGLEVVVGRLLVRAGLRLAVAESLTGGMVGARLTTVPGASDWFAGGLVAYGSDVKRALLGVGPGPVVSEQAAREMALGVVRLLGADVGLSLTGVAGPAPQDDQPPGTVFVGLAGLPADAVAGRPGSRATQLALRGQRPMVREIATTSALDYLRRALSAPPGPPEQ